VKKAEEVKKVARELFIILDQKGLTVMEMYAVVQFLYVSIQTGTIIYGLPPSLLPSDQTDKCELCGKKAKTRSCGLKGESICFSCAMKDKEIAKLMMESYIIDDRHFFCK